VYLEGGRKMKEKILGIIICMLLIAATVLPVTGTKNVYELSKETQVLIEAPQVIVFSEMENKQEVLDRGDDVLVTGTEVDEINSSIVSYQYGNLFISVERLGSIDPGVYLYKSTDHGKSWNLWALIKADITNPSLAINGFDDLLFLTFCMNGDTIWVYRLDADDPSIWDGNLIEYNAMGVANPKIVTDDFWEDYSVFLIYNSGTLLDQDTWELKFSRSLDEGENWESPIILHVYEDVPFYDGRYAHPDIDFSFDTVCVVFDDVDHNDDERDVYVMYSDNDGVTWSIPEKVAENDFDDEYDPSVVVNLPYILITYTAEYSITDHDIWYAYSQDSGVTWNKYIPLDVSYDNDTLSDLAKSYNPYDGNFHVVYMKNSDIVYRNTNYSPISWSTPIIINEDSSAAHGYSPAIAVNPNQIVDKEAIITWTDFRNTGMANDIYFDSNATGPYYPAICCTGFLNFEKIKPGETVTGSIRIRNCGEPDSFLNWEIDDFPTWGSFSFNPNSGSNLPWGNNFDYVDVTIVAPDVSGETFTGYVKVINTDDPSDFCEAYVYLQTSKDKSINSPFLIWLQSHPNMFPILQRLFQRFGLQ
jgi:hypothetical protein